MKNISTVTSKVFLTICQDVRGRCGHHLLHCGTINNQKKTGKSWFELSCLWVKTDNKHLDALSSTRVMTMRCTGHINHSSVRQRETNETVNPPHNTHFTAVSSLTEVKTAVLTTQSARPTPGWESPVWPQSPGYTWRVTPPWCWSVSPASPFSSWSWTSSPSYPPPPAGSGPPGFPACSRGRCNLAGRGVTRRKS